MSDQSQSPPRLIEIVGENRRDMVSLDAIVSVGLRPAHDHSGYHIHILLGERLVSMEFFYRSEPQAFHEYTRINDARQAMDAWIKSL